MYVTKKKLFDNKVFDFFKLKETKKFLTVSN